MTVASKLKIVEREALFCLSRRELDNKRAGRIQGLQPLSGISGTTASLIDGLHGFRFYPAVEFRDSAAASPGNTDRLKRLVAILRHDGRLLCQRL